MPANRNALIRYRTIDNCLRNRQRRWTLDDLIETVSDALYEYEGIDKGVSRRTIQADIQILRSDKLGYNAPIIVKEKKYYTYDDADYSITNSPLTEQDLSHLSETVDFLKQFKGFNHFMALDGMVQKLEDHIYSQRTDNEPVIDFEQNENLKGLEYIDPLYQYIIKKKTVVITYQSFKARQPSDIDFHPFLLKEYRNRWFVIGNNDNTGKLLTLALDRIHRIGDSSVLYKRDKGFIPNQFFKNAIGVSVDKKSVIDKVVLRFTRRHAPYVETKPMHWSQKTIARDNFGITVQLDVVHNFELEKDILGFGDGVRVLEPKRLRKSIFNRIQYAKENYDTELSEKGLQKTNNLLEHRGSAIINRVYPIRNIKKLDYWIRKYRKDKEEIVSIGNLLEVIPETKEFLFTQNLDLIIQEIIPNGSIIRADLHLGHSDTWTNNEWYQYRDLDRGNMIMRFFFHDMMIDHGAAQVYTGSHKALHDREVIKVITENTEPAVTEVGTGGLHIFHPWLLQRYPAEQARKGRRMIEMICRV